MTPLEPEDGARGGGGVAEHQGAPPMQQEMGRREPRAGWGQGKLWGDRCGHRFVFFLSNVTFKRVIFFDS